jgi:hypothetical protein
MSFGYVVLAAVVLLCAWMARVNARYTAAEAARAQGPDAEVESLWSVFGLPEQGSDLPARVGDLLERVTPDDLRTKHGVVALAIMAARSGHHDVLEALARRAARLDGGCGETAALGVLAAAYGGDLRLAMERQSQSQSAMASCASCGASGDAKILLQEAEIALDALRSGALETAGEALHLRVG